MSLPDFVNDVLPPGDYKLTMQELRASMLVQGRFGVTEPNWDVSWRSSLLDNLEILTNQLHQIGLDQIFIDGSFVENKAHPSDIDGYFECPWQEQANGDLESKLNAIDPHTVWTWDWSDRQLFAGKMRLPMWMHYRCELYPHLTGLPYHQSTGITDQFGNDLEFPSAFRQSRGFVQKGIVKLIA
jgi:hypothetical protein